MIDPSHALIIRILHQPTKSSPEAASGEKIKRDAFLYLEGDDENFAQCGTCWMFKPEEKRCAVFTDDFEVEAEDSCGLYMEGEPLEGLPIIERVTPEEAGFVEHEVRCENCKFGGKDCQLFVMLNRKLPDVFDLDTKIKPRGCCNAQTPK